MTPRTCPRCGSHDVRRRAEAGLACNACAFTFDEPSAQGAPTPVPSAAATPPATASAEGASSYPFRRLGLLAAVLLAGAVGINLWSNRMPSRELQLRPALPSPTSAELEGVIRAPLDDHGAFWLFDYVNTGTTPIAKPAAELSFLDANERVIDTLRVQAQVPDQLAPGERITLRIESRDPPPHVQIKLQAVPPTRAHGGPTMVPLITRDIIAQPDGSLRGTLQAPEGMSLQILSIKVIGRREDGAPVAWAAANTDANTISVGETLSFTAQPTARLTAVAPARWTVQAWGEPLQGGVPTP